MDNIQRALTATAAKRAQMLEELYDRCFLLGGMPNSDVYKEVMWGAFPELSTLDSAYHLTFRRALNEPDAGNQLIMAGHKEKLSQYFRRPLKRSDIELMDSWSEQNSEPFPREMWAKVLADQPGDDIYLPVDVYGFPGGQTFLKGVPALTFEGMGGVISYLEPHMCRYYRSIIQATRGRLFHQVAPNNAEFGLRGFSGDDEHLFMLLARYVGSGGSGSLTSNVTACFLFPRLFKKVGTTGHELVCANQRLDKPLAQSELEMMEEIVKRIPNAKVLTDLVDPETVGLWNFLEALRRHPEATGASCRQDSGDIAGLLCLYHEKMKEHGFGVRKQVFEDEVTPTKSREVFRLFKERTGDDPASNIPGAGGYWENGNTRDAVSAAFKRSETNGNPNVKFSAVAGKESIPGRVRVYGDGDTMVVADKSEDMGGLIPLYVQLVRQGRIVYDESPEAQAARANLTWGKYTQFRLSPVVQNWMDRFRSTREAEVTAARAKLNCQSAPPPIPNKAANLPH